MKIKFDRRLLLLAVLFAPDLWAALPAPTLPSTAPGADDWLAIIKGYIVPERKPSFLKIPATQPEFFRVLLVNDRQKQAGFRSCREGFLISPNSRRTSP